jgi:hypothetical protein
LIIFNFFCQSGWLFWPVTWTLQQVDSWIMFLNYDNIYFYLCMNSG